METSGCVKFADNVVMSEDNSANIGWGQDLVAATLDFVKRLVDIDIDHTEFCLLNAVVLTYPG